MLLCLGPLGTQQSFNKWGLMKLNFPVHKNSNGKICFFNQTGSLYLLISSVYILLCARKRKKKARNGRFSRFQTSAPLCADFLRTFVCIALPNTVTKFFNQIWIYDVTGVAYWKSRFVVVCSGTHNDNTSIVHFFLFPLPFLRSTEHFSLKPSSSIKQRRRNERLCS